MFRYVIYFLTFSFLGWCAEVLFHIFKEGRVVNRGLAYGPVCPIYGVGVCLCALLLCEVESLPLLFLLCAAIATVTELMIGLLCDWMIGHRLWSYEGEWGNIMGLVCPHFSLLWGFLLMLTIIALPLFDRVTTTFDGVVYRSIALLLLVIMLLDIVFSILKIKRQNTRFNAINNN